MKKNAQDNRVPFVLIKMAHVDRIPVEAGFCRTVLYWQGRKMRKGTEKESLDEWFGHNVLPHEAALVNYLRRHWTDGPADVNDVCQEALTRVYAAAREARPVHPKSFLFTTARRLIFDLLRRGQIVQIDSVMDLEALNVSIDEAGPEDQLSARQELRLLQDAMETLPVKCRQVIELRRVHGYSQRETAKRLSITESAVEAQIQRGVLRLAKALRHVSDVAAKRLARKSQRAEKERKS